MRSRCRSLFLSISLLSAFNVLAIGNQSFPGTVTAVLAKGTAETPSTTVEADESKCTTGPTGPTSAAAHAHRYPGGISGEGSLGHMALDLSNLNLTEDQKNKIKTIRGRNVARAKELRQQVQTRAHEFRDLIFSESATNDQITAKRDEIRPLKDELENLRLNDLLAIRAVLTTEQRKKWAETKPADHKHPGGADADAEKNDKGDKGNSSGNASTKSK